MRTKIFRINAEDWNPFNMEQIQIIVSGLHQMYPYLLFAVHIDDGLITEVEIEPRNLIQKIKTLEGEN